MAVEIPVYVDIDKAFQDAAKRVPQAIAPLQKQISKKQLNVSVNVGTKNNQVIRKFKDLLSESNSSATQLERALANVNAQIRAMQKSGGFNPAKGLKKGEKDLLALRAALELKLEGGNFIDDATQKIKNLSAATKTAGATAETAINRTNAGLRTQSGLLGMITRYFSAYTAVFAGLRLARNIRETTAEFEMQRVALGGIIQDATRAAQLFGQIKAAAVQSPFEIKDLVSFTKQLSAYRIETDKLFDVTMRLADVSAGLGVDMSRLVLAYGQVRAASVLRGQELRQFTEAGIPLVDELAKKFTKLRGELVSTGEVFELISDRAVPFSMIAEIFEDMTNTGGIFYQMQLKQSETLKGQWMKLKDVISIAYDEMGRSAMVNQLMRDMISTIQNLVKNWEKLSQVADIGLSAFVAYKAAMGGLIPFYNAQQKAIVRQIQLEKKQQVEAIRLASTHDKLTASEQKRIASIQKITAADYKRIYAMDKMTASQAMLTFWRNKDNKEIVKAIKQTGILTQAQMTAIGKMDWFQVHVKAWGSSIRTFFTSIGTALKAFWPIALVSAIITTITNIVSAHKEQVEAIKKVNAAYSEQEQTLLKVENAYYRIQKAIADEADEQERAAKAAASFGQKLEYAQQIVEQLKKYGVGGDFDLSLLDVDNIDEFVYNWLTRLKEANELTQAWGLSVAKTLTAAEGPLHIFGDNLKTDIKQLSAAYAKLTSSKMFRKSIDEMRNYIDELELNNKGVYDQLSDILDEDAKIAISQKRRNESEYQYQMRIIRNYEKIRNQIALINQYTSGDLSSFGSMYKELDKFDKKLDEVEREFDKTWDQLEGHDEMTIKMAIDKMFAENEWEDWLKEAWIERVNGKYQMNIQITPSIETPDVARGMKGILETEFSDLFTPEELANLNTVSEIGKAIEEKMKNAATAMKEANSQANNLLGNELWADKTKKRIMEAQITINEELAKDEKDRNDSAIREAQELIDALTKQNETYEKQIEKKKESAEADYKMARAAKERLLSEGLSDIGKDIKKTFPELLTDEALDTDIVSRFLITDDDLAKIHDAVDAYDLWAKNMKALADEREKLEGAGVDEATVAQEQAELDERRIELQQQLEEVEEQIAAWSYEEQKAQYDSLRLAVEQATCAEDRKIAEENLNKFLNETNFAERAALVIEKERLLAQLGITNSALEAKNAILDTFAAIEEGERVWGNLGQRYNFLLRDKPTGGNGQDPWILLFKNRMKFMQDFQKSVADLDKYLTHSESLGLEQDIMKGRGLSLGINTESLVGTPNELREWYDKAIKEVAAKIRSMGGREFAGMGVTEILAQDLNGRKIQKYQELLQELWDGLTDFDTNELKNSIEANLKKVTDEVKRSETARNFFKNMLDLTGDQEMAATLTASVYGGVGEDFKERLQKQLDAAFQSLDWTELPDNVWGQLSNAIVMQDFDALLDHIDLFPEKWQEVIKQMKADSEKNNADWLMDFEKTYAKAMTYDDRVSRLRAQQEQKEIEARERGKSPEEVARVTEYYNREVAKVQLEAMKDTYTWTKAFEDLEGVSDRTLENLISLIDDYVNKYGKDLEPQQLKELVRAKEMAKQQKTERNSFASLSKAVKDYVFYADKRNFLEEIGIDDGETYTKILDAQQEAIKRLGESYDKALSEMNEYISSLKELMSIFASDKDASYFSEQLDSLSKVMSGVGKAGIGIAQLATGQITPQAIMQTVTGIADVIVGIFGAGQRAKLRRINNQLEYQEDLLADLERSYDRLDKAMAKAFGSDYIYNYNEQLKNLAAQQEAYEKQAQLEREKGKKADEEKIKEYEQSAEDVAQNISDMQSQLAEHFAGTDLTSAARDFANSWIDAYKEFGSTTDAMKEKFQEMVQNMIVESLAAKLIEEQLGPIFDMIDRLSKDDGILSAQDVADIARAADEVIPAINNTMTGLMSSLTAYGYNVRQGLGQFTGISRDIAGASEESINGLAAGINTQNFYMSLISQNVAAILASMTGQEVSGVAGAAAPTDPYKDAVLEHMSMIPLMHEDMYAIRSMLEKVIRPNGTTATHYVATRS